MSAREDLARLFWRLVELPGSWDDGEPEDQEGALELADAVIREWLPTLGTDRELQELVRKAVEDTLIEFRDSRISFPMRNNGLVVKEKDGTESSIIRLGAEGAWSIGVRTVAGALAGDQS